MANSLQTGLGRRDLLLGGPFLVTACRKRRTGFLGYLFVANSAGGSLAVVDLSALAVARWIRLGANPIFVVDVPGRPFVYALAAEEGLLFEISVGTLDVQRRLRVGRGVLAMKRCPLQESVCILANDPARLITVSLDDFRVARVVDVSGPAADFDLSRDGAWAAVTVPEKREVVFCGNGGATHQVRLARAAQQIRFRSDGRQVLVTHPEEREIAVLEAPESGVRPGGSLLVRLPLAVRPQHLCFKADGGQLFVSGAGEDAIAAIYPFRTEVAETFLAGKDPGAMAVSSAPEYLFVANQSISTVTILNIVSRKVMGVVNVGNDPCFIGITPDNRFAVVLNRGSGDVAVIRLEAIGRHPREKLTPLLSMVPVGSAPVHAVVHPL